MSLNKKAAINYNNACGYSQKATGIIQMFVGAKSFGYFDNQTVEAVYAMQQKSSYGFQPGAADGKVGPSTLGVIIMELEYLSRMSEAAVLKSYCYKINGELINAAKKPQTYTPPKSTDVPPDAPIPDEVLDEKNKDFPRQVYRTELRNIWTGPGTIPHPWGEKHLVVGNLYLAFRDIRKVLGVANDDIYYMVVKTESDVLDKFNVGKVYKQTKRGFCSEVDWAALTQVARSAKGGMEFAKKEVELLMGAVLAGVGAFGGVAAVTAAAMNILLNNSEDIFKAARALEALIKVKNVLASNTPEFWQLCKTVLRLSWAKTPESMWSDPYGSIRLAGELVMIVGEAVFLKQVRSIGFIAKLVLKVMQGLFSKMIDAGTLALDQKDLAAAIKQADPNLDKVKIDKIVKELKDNWHIVEPALKTLKAVADQLGEAIKVPDRWSE